jgi:hypothetical protein
MGLARLEGHPHGLGLLHVLHIACVLKPSFTERVIDGKNARLIIRPIKTPRSSVNPGTIKNSCFIGTSLIITYYIVNRCLCLVLILLL